MEDRKQYLISCPTQLVCEVYAELPA